MRIAAIALFLFFVGAGCGGPVGTAAQCLTNTDCGSGQVCDYATSRCVVSTPKDASALVCSQDTWTNYASQAMSTNCGGCHGWAGSRTSIAQDAVRIRANIATDSMPPNVGLPQTDRYRLLNWIDCGMPQ